MSIKERSFTIITKTHHAAERIKEKFPTSVPFSSLIDYCFTASERSESDALKQFKRALKYRSDVRHDEADDSFRFRPPYSISTPEQLVGYFQRQEQFKGIEVRDLKQGWVDCEDTIDRLEREHKLIVLRNKKDNHARTIWPDEPDLHAPLEEEFIDIWNRQPLPDKDEVIRSLQAGGHVPTGEVTRMVVKGPTEKKKRKQRANTKQTNRHMQGIFKDYSGSRPKGK